MSWAPLPDLLSIGLLIYAFVSVSRHGERTQAAHYWLVGWIMVEVHFLAAMFATIPGPLGLGCSIVTVSALTWAALCFSRSIGPDPDGIESRCWTWGMCVINTLVVSSMYLPHCPLRLRTMAGILYALLPVAFALRARLAHRTVGVRSFEYAMYGALSALLLIAHSAPLGSEPAPMTENAILTLPYIVCCVRFIDSGERKGAGFVVTAVGLFAWSTVFFVAQWFEQHLPNVHVDVEIWNLPKFVVAVGMLLLLLESEVAYNSRLAQHDSLTNLPNRRHFLERMTSAIDQARSAGTSIALLSIDLDGFKQVNDQFGHQAGDAALRSVASVFSAQVRSDDLVARIGGDEFAIVLEGSQVEERALMLAQELPGLLKDPIRIGTESVKLGASVGVALFPTDATTVELLCATADRRMYRVKGMGGTLRAHVQASESAQPASGALQAC